MHIFKQWPFDMGHLQNTLGRYADKTEVDPMRSTAELRDYAASHRNYEESYSNDGGTTWVRSFIANLTRLKQ